MTHTDPQYFLETVKALAKDASDRVFEVYKRDDFQVETKANDTPLTRADRISHDVIVEGLHDTPYPVLSEEGEQPSYADRKSWHRFWLIDPLDGTSGFVHKSDHFTVNIALIEGDRPILGVVAQPVTQELFFATKNNGAYKEVANKTAPIACRASGDVCRIVTSHTNLSENTKAFVADREPVEMCRLGSSEKFMYVADGRADFYPRFGHTMEWDTAAAQIIVEEAGGCVVDAETGEPLRYNKPDLRNPFFIARRLTADC